MNFRVIFCLLLTLTGLLALTGARAGADPVAAFFAARAQAGGVLTGAAAADAAAHPGSYGGRTADLAASVSGLVMVDGSRTALLSVGGPSVGELSGGGPSLSVLLPASLNGATWLDSGTRVRVLLRLAPDDPALPSGVRLVALAPEGDIVAVEKRRLADASRQQALLARSLPYVSFGTGRRGRTSWAADTGGHPAGALSARASAIYAPYHALVRRWNRRLSETEVDKITTSILYFSDLNNLDPRLVVATIIAESDFDIHSTSRAGAMGLAQIMPDEAQGLGVTNAYDPIQNIGAAVHLLRGHLDKYGGAPADAGIIPFRQIALTMAAYNAGPGAVRKYHGVPPYRETRRYIARITALYRQMCGLSQQASTK